MVVTGAALVCFTVFQYQLGNGLVINYLAAEPRMWYQQMFVADAMPGDTEPRRGVPPSNNR